jgi:hypothetical protein
MPGTRRTPIRRQHTSLITAQAVALYQRALKARAKVHLSDELRQAAHDAERDCDRLLGLRLWDFSIFDDFMFDCDEPPKYLLERGVRAADGWWHVKELRRQLVEADRELRRQRRGARRAAKAIPEPAREPEPAG